MDITFHEGTNVPAKYRGGAFVGLHGSWNRAQLNGYKVLLVPFDGAAPPDAAEDFLTGFVKEGSTTEAYGRPVATAPARRALTSASRARPPAGNDPTAACR